MTDRELMQMAQNTDRELWREREGDFYADSIHVTKDGGIGMNVGGTVFVMTIKAWHSAAALRDRLAQPEPVHASDMSQERVDETAKSEHDIVGACVTCGAPHGFWLSAPPTDFISPSVVKAISKREWVGLTDEEFEEYSHWIYPEKLIELENLLKEKNT